MRRHVALVCAVGTAGYVPFAGAKAAMIQGSGSIDLHAGYGSNPFFNPASSGGSALLGATLSGVLTRMTAVSQSSLTGQVDIDGYLRHYGRTENYSATLRHNQQLSQALAVGGQVSYDSIINPSPSFGTRSADLQTQGDLLTVGQRTRRISGSGDISWEHSEHDLFQAGVNASHATFSGGAASSYSSYGASIGYLRTLNDHTKIGIQGGVNMTKSSDYPDSHSFNVGLQLIQQISPVWRFEGGVSLLAQSTLGRLYKTVGFNGSLCGTYPRLTVCAVASRNTAPSGFGGLRTDTQGGGRVNYKLTPHSFIELSATYDISSSKGGILPTQKYYDLATAYRRELSPRLSVGASARLQGRDYGTLLAGTQDSKVTGYTATANVVWKFGRIS